MIPGIIDGSCPACGSSKWTERNFGTEKIEEQIGELFPDYKVARMDVDTVKGKTAHDTLIQQFEQQRIDILVGTQMVVKGLDFDHVQLVGILDADGLLSFADFRVNERAFQFEDDVIALQYTVFQKHTVHISSAEIPLFLRCWPGNLRTDHARHFRVIQSGHGCV